jgi:hypothetical protein
MSVEQYAARFNELSRYAPTLVATEEAKVHRFLYGLIPRVRDKVICLDIKEFLKMVDKATLAEKSIKGGSYRLCPERSETCLLPPIRQRSKP